MMCDLTNRKLIYLKGVLFLVCGALAAVVLLLEHPSLRTALLLALAIWCFARFYYFCFYVIERYVDPAYRFSGLWSFARYALWKGRPSSTDAAGPRSLLPVADRNGR